MNDLSPDILNLPEALERVEGDKELLLNLLKEFVFILPEQLIKLDAAIRSESFSEAKLLAHSIKGAGRNLSAGRVAQCALQLETAAQMADLESMRQALQRMEKEVQILSDLVRSGVL